MATNWKDIKHKNMTPERIAHLDGKLKEELLQMELRDLRLEAGQTQEELAEAVDMTQPELSRFERREDHLLSSVRRYVEGLGGKLEVVAVLGNKRITLQGV
jgi:predicted transcriptional regulator